MNKIVRILAVGIIAAVCLSSCAKEPTVDWDTLREDAFEAWMSRNGDGAEKQESGVYIKKLHSESNVVKPPKDGDWVLIDYTGRLMITGDVFTTRDSAVAQRQGTFQYYTHYAPELVQYKQGEAMIDGLYYALATMTEGDSVAAYIPPALSYGTYGGSFGNGYQGEVSSVSANTPVIMNLRLDKIVPDPLSYENTLVREYAYEKWGLGVNDTVAKNMYRRVITPGRDTARVGKDSIVCLYYVGQFLDGFVFDTNMADTARKHHIYDPDNSNKYDSISLTVGSRDTAYIKGFYTAVEGLRYGDVAQVVFPSTYGYGSTGISESDATVIGPYSPLVFTIEVLPRYGDGTARHPYTRQGVQSVDGNEDGVWATGFVVGAVEGASVETSAKYSDTVTVKTNILLSDIRTASDPSRVFAVELPEGEIRDALNLVDNPSIYRKKIAVYGNITQYLGEKGMVGTTQYTK